MTGIARKPAKTLLPPEAHLFDQLKPVCVNVTKECSIQHLNEALQVLRSLDKHSINDIAMLEYVLFPFRTSLQKRKTLKEKQELLCYKCLSVVLTKSHSSVIREEIISWCLNTFSLYFASMNANGFTGKISEEHKLAMVKLLQSCFVNINSTTMAVLYSAKFLPVFGHVVSILLDMLVAEKNQKLQADVVVCIRTLSGYSMKGRYLSELAGKCWASFLPGTCSSFNKLFTLTNNVAQNVLALSLETLGYIIYAVLNDQTNVDLLPAEVSLEEMFSSKLETKNGHVGPLNADLISETRNHREIGVQRTHDWLTKTSQHMNLVLKNILPVLMCHSQPKVRIALLTFVELLLSTCSRSLSSSLMDFLDVLLKHSCDESENVKTEAVEIITRNATLFHNNKHVQIQSLLKERLYSELISMPRIVNGASEEVKIAKLQVIKGYMEFYGDHLSTALSTQSLLERFITSLTHVLELEVSDVNLVEQKTSIFRQAIEFESESYDNKFYRKNFKFFRNMSVLRLIKEIIHLLARWGDVTLIFDYLIEQGLNSALLRSQSFIIINELLMGMAGRELEDIALNVDIVLSTYVDDQLMKLPVSNNPLLQRDNIVESDEHMLTTNKHRPHHYLESTISFEVLNSNIQLICILLEGISNCAELLQTEFNLHLMNTLYPILEKVGSTNAAVSSSAVETLNTIVRCCCYDNINDLIYRNSDYLLNSITLQFRRLSVGSAAPAVLCVVLRYCDASLMEIVLDVIENVFAILDEYGEEVAGEMLLVLRHYNMAVDKCYNSDTSESSTRKLKTMFQQKDKQREPTDIFNEEISLDSFVEQYCKLTVQSQGNVAEEEFSPADINEEDFKNDLPDDEPETNEEQNCEEEKEEKEETPFHFKVVVTSLEKCVVYVAARDNRIRLNALDVVLQGVNALRNRENDLLPLIHKLWPPIICRLKETEFTLVLKAFDVVCSMVEYSGNFMTKRLTQDFLPYALQFLQKHDDDVTKNECTFTQVFKITKKLITFLGDTLPHLDPPRDLFCDICSSVIKYTKSTFHAIIQETAVTALTKLYAYKPSVVWVLCQALCSRNGCTPPPHTSLRMLNFEKMEDNTKLCQYNLVALLELFGR